MKAEMDIKKDIRNTKGQALVLYALAIIVLFGFGALAIDIGHLYHVKDELQNAADAAALAGAAELDGTNATLQTAARDAAKRIALKNVADTANAAISTGNLTVGAGDPLPVYLDRNDGNDVNGDIVVGNWDTTKTPAFSEVRTPINAVMAVAKRAGDRPEQPRSQNWFARIFALLQPIGVHFDFAKINATAIASSEPVKLLPIAVNEYWNETVDKSGVAQPGKPYLQKYPESFMRSINADAVDGVSSTTARGGTVFAVFGQNANDNNAPAKNLNSFVDILYRDRFHTPRGPKDIKDNPAAGWLPVSDNGDQNPWYAVNSGTGGTCPCGNLTPIPDGVKSSLNTGKFDIDANFGYLFDGIPDNIIPPNAVREVIRPNPFYPLDNYNNCPDANDCCAFVKGETCPDLSLPHNNNDPSNCPFASIPYFSSSGGDIVQHNGPVGPNFRETYPKGTIFMVMVYDGTIQANPDANQANVVTIIGYGFIQIDGYDSGALNTVADFKKLDPGGPKSGGNTAYGHALKHKVAGQDDLYLLQPPDSPNDVSTSSARKGNCAFTDLIRQARKNFVQVRLVGTSPYARYGVAD